MINLFQYNCLSTNIINAQVADVWKKKRKQNSNPEIIKTIIVVGRIFLTLKI